jgi:glycyl-tRNA synthetase beta chain
LLPAFVVVNNTRPQDLALVCRGHERVLRARLADAAFFVREDSKRPLISRLEDLKQVTYHAKLGSSFDKVERCSALAQFLGRSVGLAASDMVKLQRAAQLAKCDLTTGLVGEFAELQGQVGQEYALGDGEDKEVAQAVAEHYLPLFAGGPLPAGVLGALLGIADRLDTICGCFSVGLIPTGAADPYGLRRAAIAIIRIITEKNFGFSLVQALDKALSLLQPWRQESAETVQAKVMEFIAARLAGVWADEGIGPDVAQAVIAAGMDDLTALRARAAALASMKKSKDFVILAAGLKRVFNILRKDPEAASEALVQSELLRDEAEKELYQQFSALKAEAGDRKSVV